MLFFEYISAIPACYPPDPSQTYPSGTGYANTDYPSGTTSTYTPSVEELESDTGIQLVDEYHANLPVRQYPNLTQWKNYLVQELNSQNVPGNTKNIILAMAMQETNDFHSYDSSKDSEKYGERNFGLLNLNEELIHELDNSLTTKNNDGTFTPSSALIEMNDLSSDSSWENSISMSVKLAAKGLQLNSSSPSYTANGKNYTWQPINSFLNFDRAGSSGMISTGSQKCSIPDSNTGTKDGECDIFRGAIASMAYMLSQNRTLWNDGLRIDSDCEHE